MEFNTASRKRRVFAIYLDLLVVGAIVAPIAHRLGFLNYQWPIALALVTVLELAVDNLRRRSPGEYLLGILRTPEGRAIVDDELRRDANWFILAIAFCQFYAGVRIFIDGVAKYDVYYLMGNRITGQEVWIFLTIYGVLTIWNAAALFRCRVFAPMAGILLQLLVVVSTWMSKTVALEVASEVIARRVLERPERGAIMTAEQLFQLELALGMAYLLALGFAATALRNRFSLRAAPIQ